MRTKFLSQTTFPRFSPALDKVQVDFDIFNTDPGFEMEKEDYKVDAIGCI